MLVALICAGLPAWGETLVERKGDARASVSPEADTEGLANATRLDAQEAERWITVDDEQRWVPNTVVIDLGSATPWSPPRHAVAIAFRKMAKDYADEQRELGYRVVLRVGVDVETSKAALTEMTAEGTLAKYAFFGHGDHGIINTAYDDQTGLVPDRYVSYGLAELRLHSCGSLKPSGAAVPYLANDGETRFLGPGTASRWRYNVAPAGRLTGYLAREVTAFTADLTVGQPGLRPPPPRE